MSFGTGARGAGGHVKRMAGTGDLRLVYPPTAGEAAGKRTEAQRLGKAIAGANDPRWVLAVRTSELLEGTILPGEARQRLVRLGRVMGLTAFDANLVIAIVQDQARRGHAPSYCPTAGEEQLRMVPMGRRGAVTGWARGRIWRVAMLAAGLVGLEAAMFMWWMR